MYPFFIRSNKIIFIFLNTIYVPVMLMAVLETIYLSTTTKENFQYYFSKQYYNLNVHSVSDQNSR